MNFLDPVKQEHEAYMGWSECRICGCINGSRDLTDGVYLWPEGFSHYVRVHNIKPSERFIKHVLAAPPVEPELYSGGPTFKEYEVIGFDEKAEVIRNLTQRRKRY
jgi:hypothetical protein